MQQEMSRFHPGCWKPQSSDRNSEESGCFHFPHTLYPVWKYNSHSPAGSHVPFGTSPSRLHPASWIPAVSLSESGQPFRRL